MKTAKLLNASIILFILSMTAAFTWSALGFKNADTPFVALLLTLCFGLNVAGIFVGFTEKRKSRRKFLYGIIGNSIFTVMYIGFFIYAIMTIES